MTDRTAACLIELPSASETDVTLDVRRQSECLITDQASAVSALRAYSTVMIWLCSAIYWIAQPFYGTDAAQVARACVNRFCATLSISYHPSRRMMLW